MMRLGKILNQMSPDLLCLQEVQSNIYLPILEHTLTTIPHLAFQKNRQKPFGGLLTASRVPYTHWAFHPFPNRGRKWSIGYADWALHKGVIAAHVYMDGLKVTVLNTHLQANYVANWVPGNNLAGIQKDQVDFLADLVQAQDEKTLVVVCGDLNFPPHTFLYHDLIKQGGLSDPLEHDPRPTYQPFPLVPATWTTRLDYALYRAPKGLDLNVSIDIIRVLDRAARLPWNRFLTDHFLLKLVLTWMK